MDKWIVTAFDRRDKARVVIRQNLSERRAKELAHSYTVNPPCDELSLFHPQRDETMDDEHLYPQAVRSAAHD